MSWNPIAGAARQPPVFGVQKMTLLTKVLKHRLQILRFPLPLAIFPLTYPEPYLKPRAPTGFFACPTRV